MSYKEYSNRMNVLIRLIKAEKTGTAQNLADELGVCRRTVFDCLSHLKDEGILVKFCRQRRTYYIVE